MPPNTVYVGRPTKWGNPFETVADYRDMIEWWINFDVYNKVTIINELRGKNLACWCSLKYPCHADLLLNIANK